MIVLRGRSPTPIISLCICGLVLLSSCLRAAATDCSTPNILLSIIDSDPGIQPGLRADDLKVEVDHRQSQILNLSLDTNPRRIVLMVDTSGSMAPPGRGWGLTLPAAGYAVEAIPANASSTLVTFADKVESGAKTFEEKPATIAAVLELAKVQPKGSGSTALFDSIDHVLAEFQELRFGDAIYLVTDGGDNRRRVSLPQLEEKLISRGIRALVFLVVKGGFQTHEEAEGVSEVEALAESTGGAVVRISSADVAGSGRADLEKLVPRITDQVESVYRADLDIPNPKKVSHVKIGFVNQDRTKSVHNIAYSREVVPCSQKP